MGLEEAAKVLEGAETLDEGRVDTNGDGLLGEFSDVVLNLPKGGYVLTIPSPIHGERSPEAHDCARWLFVVQRAEDGRTHCRLLSTRTNDYLFYSVSALLLLHLLSRATSVTHGHLAVSANLGAHDGITISDHGFVAGSLLQSFRCSSLRFCKKQKKRITIHRAMYSSQCPPWVFYICACTGGLKGKS